MFLKRRVFMLDGMLKCYWTELTAHGSILRRADRPTWLQKTAGCLGHRSRSAETRQTTQSFLRLHGTSTSAAFTPRTGPRPCTWFRQLTLYIAAATPSCLRSPTGAWVGSRATGGGSLNKCKRLSCNISIMYGGGGGVEVYCNQGWSTSNPGLFMPGKETRCPSYRQPDRPRGLYDWDRKISVPPGFERLRFPSRLSIKVMGLNN